MLSNALWKIGCCLMLASTFGLFLLLSEGNLIFLITELTFYFLIWKTVANFIMVAFRVNLMSYLNNIETDVEVEHVLI